jgi:rhodanese-related sulfurtransferase
MPKEVELDALLELIDGDAQLVEVLPHHKYEDEHIPNAINIPLETLTDETTRSLDQSRPIVVYCWDDA